MSIALSKEYCGLLPLASQPWLCYPNMNLRGAMQRGAMEINQRCVFQSQNGESNPCRPSPIWRKREACGPEGRIFVEAIE